MMNLNFKNDYQSIKQFNSVEMADFSIITGINGSGKTHLLKALHTGDVEIDSIHPDEMVFFDFIQFRAENEAECSREQITTERKDAWNFLVTSNISAFGILRDVLVRNRNAILSENDSIVLKTITLEKNKPLLSLDEQDIENEELRTKFFKYKKNLNKILFDEKIRNHPHKQGIVVLLQKLNLFLDEISELEFKTTYMPAYLKENFLPRQIGRIFLDYRTRVYEEYHELCDSNPTESWLSLKQKAEEKHRQRYGGYTPWDILNDFLNAYGNFDYTISSPNEFTTNTYLHQSTTPFTPKLVNSKENLEINYDQLSSGEQILFALALCLFKSKSDNIFPKLLLLDEIDASLHPSMIKNLLNVIQEVLLKQGTKVILSSHSPTTISLAPEESIFVVNKHGENRIEKRDRKDALEILTEGFMTIDKGIKILDRISNKEISIISEGKNTEYLEKAIQLFGDINKIEVVKGAESITGTSQLKTLYDFFYLIAHEKKVIFVFDVDYTTKFKENRNTLQYILPKNDTNNITRKGIENLFDEDQFEGFTVSVTDDATGETRREFNEKKMKKKFLEHIMTAANETTFRNFKPFMEYVNSKLGN